MIFSHRFEIVGNSRTTRFLFSKISNSKTKDRTRQKANNNLWNSVNSKRNSPRLCQPCRMKVVFSSKTLASRYLDNNTIISAKLPFLSHFLPFSNQIFIIRASTPPPPKHSLLARSIKFQRPPPLLPWTIFHVRVLAYKPSSSVRLIFHRTIPSLFSSRRTRKRSVSRSYPGG